MDQQAARDLMDSDLSGSELAVALALWSFSDAQGRCWPAVPSLARRSGWSEREVYRVIPRLEVRGVLVADRKVGRSTNYRVNADASTWHPCLTGTPDGLAPLPNGHPTPVRRSGVPLSDGQGYPCPMGTLTGHENGSEERISERAMILSTSTEPEPPTLRPADAGPTAPTTGAPSEDEPWTPTTAPTPPMPISSEIGTTTAGASERRRTAATAAGGTPAGASHERASQGPPAAAAAPESVPVEAQAAQGAPGREAGARCDASTEAAPGAATAAHGAEKPEAAGDAADGGSHGRPLTIKAAAKWGSLSAVWAVLMADRAELQPGSRGLVLTTEGKQARAPALRGVLRALDQSGHGLDELRAALRWLYTSTHFRARSAREAQDPMMALLRHAVDYVDLALDGAQAPAQAAPHASTAPVAPPTRQEAPSAPPVVAEVVPELPAEPYVPFRPEPPKDWKPPPPPFALLTGGRRHG